MTKFADAVIGDPGEGLNVEQRKRVTIGVELAARPELLLFLDEPTSGLDSNTAWSICVLLRKLADNGQAILCTVHQPSGTMFELFDRLLFLTDGKCAYFGDIGPNSQTLREYFESYGSRICEPNENPAEWLLSITKDNQESRAAGDWAEVWRKSREREDIHSSIKEMKKILAKSATDIRERAPEEFATSLAYQLYTVTKRNFEHDWRSPSYLYSKLFLTIGSVLGFLLLFRNLI